MDGLAFLGVIVASFAVFDILALRFGVNSSEASTDSRDSRPSGILAN